MRARKWRAAGVVVEHQDLLIGKPREEGKWAVVGVVILKNGMTEDWSH